MSVRAAVVNFEVRIELTRRDGSQVSVQVPRDEAERLELSAGQIVDARASRERVFEPEAVASG